MRKLILVVAMVALITAPAFAAVQNVKVSGSITTTLILDNNVGPVSYNGTTGMAQGFDEDTRGSDILTQTELNVEADLTDNVSTKIGLINERVWGNTSDTASPSTDTNVDLETAYVTMKEFLYSPLTMTVGRQPLFYGNGLIIGSNSTNADLDLYNTFSKKGNFDAIKAVLGYEPVTIDLFASRIHNGEATGVEKDGNIGANNDNENLYGVVASTKLGDKMSTVLEGYLFAKIDDTTRNTTSLTTSQILPMFLA